MPGHCYRCSTGVVMSVIYEKRVRVLEHQLDEVNKELDRVWKTLAEMSERVAKLYLDSEETRWASRSGEVRY